VRVILTIWRSDVLPRQTRLDAPGPLPISPGLHQGRESDLPFFLFNSPLPQKIISGIEKDDSRANSALNMSSPPFNVQKNW